MRPAFYMLLGVLLVPTVGLVGDIVTDGKFTSTMSTGAPMEVASSDMVANLNADMVDGVEGTNIYTKAQVDALVAAAAAADSRRWFYLTTTTSQGDEALTACESGFHMANIYEIYDVSNLRYDASRGLVLDDCGQGPPQLSGGWVRTGNNAYAGIDAPGRANCNAWTSWSGAHNGTMVWLNYAWNEPATRQSPWSAASVLCNSAIWVWCVED